MPGTPGAEVPTFASKIMDQGLKNVIYPKNPGLFKQLKPSHEHKISPKSGINENRRYGNVFTSEGERPPSKFESEAR